MHFIALSPKIFNNSSGSPDIHSPYMQLQPTETQAHYLMELAKRLLTEAGGSQTTAIFNASQNMSLSNNNTHSGIY